MKHIVLICDVIWTSKTYGDYVSRKYNTQASNYILQDEDESNNWDYVKMDPVKTEVKTKNIKKENIKTKKYSRWEEDVLKTIKSVTFAKQNNQVKKDHHEDTDKKFIRALKKLDTSYNNASLNYINNKLNNMMQEDVSQEK